MHPAYASRIAPSIDGGHLPAASAECNARTNERTNARRSTYVDEGSNVSNAHRRVGHIYIVRWTEARFTKVGVSLNESRWRAFVKRGGELLGVLTEPMPQATVIEGQMHAALVRAGAIPAFLTKADAAPYLGSNGAGWTECYVDRTGREVLAHLLDWAAQRAGKAASSR